MNKRKTQNIRVHTVQRHALKIAGARLDCPIHEVVDRLMDGEAVAQKVCKEANKEAKK